MNRTLTIIGVVALLVLVVGSFVNFSQSSAKVLPATTAEDPIAVADYPVSKDLPVPAFSARNVFILDRKSRLVLFQKDAQTRVYPASTTKMMTALVTLNSYPDLEVKMTVDRNYPQPIGSGLFVAGQQLSVQELLYDMLIQSANDAAEVIAANYPGGRSAFIDAMNAKAAEIHLTDTHFVNPHGIDEEGHYSSAADLVRLADYALRNPEFEKIVGVESSVVSDKVIHNVNELLGKVEGVKGVKTGYTEGAGQSLVSWVDRNGHEILMAVLGSDDRFGDSERLIEWVYKNYDWRPVTVGMPDPTP